MFSFVFLIDLIVTILVLLDDEIVPAQPVAGLAVFGLLAAWTAKSLNNDLLNPALAFYFIFAVVHSVFSRVAATPARRHRSAMGQPDFPPLALVLVLIPIFQLAEVSFIVWPFVLLVDVLAIGLAVAMASLLPVLIVMMLYACRHRRVDFQNPRGTYRAAHVLFPAGRICGFLRCGECLGRAQIETRFAHQGHQSQ